MPTTDHYWHALIIKFSNCFTDRNFLIMIMSDMNVNLESRVVTYLGQYARHVAENCMTNEERCECLLISQWEIEKSDISNTMVYTVNIRLWEMSPHTNFFQIFLKLFKLMSLWRKTFEKSTHQLEPQISAREAHLIITTC